MKESLGNVFIFNLVVVFLGIITLILVGSLGYSKSYKVKNRIIQLIEKYGEYHELTQSDFANDGALLIDINNSLKNVGYKITKNGINNCPTTEEYGRETNYNDIELLNSISDYQYCVYKHTTSRGYYYSVLSYMYFDFPIIGEMIRIPIRSETKVIYNLCIDVDGDGNATEGECK